MIVYDAIELGKLEKQAEQEKYEIMLLQHIHFAGLPEPAREWRFHPKRKWQFDLAWPNLKIAVEVEGGVYIHGRHVRGKGYESDCEKYNEAVILGWKLLRFTTGQVKTRKAIKVLRRFFREVRK